MAVREKAIVDIELSNGKKAGQTINELTATSVKLNREIKNLKPGTEEFVRKTKDLQQVNGRLRGLRNEIRGVEVQTSSLRKGFDMATQALAPLFAAGTAMQLINGFKDLYLEVQRNRREVQKLTGATGILLDTITSKVAATASTFKKDFNETLTAANALGQQMGIDIPKALDLINIGLVSGADANGDFLEQVKEYPTHFAAAGLSASQFVAISAQASKEGIFSDKGVDAIKEATLRIREMTPATRKAMDAIGLSSEKIIEGLRDGSTTVFDVIQQVSNKLDELPPQSEEVGTAIADIFGGPGEDAGLEYLKLLGDIDLNLDNVTAKVGEFGNAQLELLKANEELEKSYNDLFHNTDGGFTRIAAAAKSVFAGILQGIADFLNAKEVSAWEKFLSVTTSVLGFGAVNVNKIRETGKKQREEREKQLEEELKRQEEENRKKAELEKQKLIEEQALEKQKRESELARQREINRLKEEEERAHLERIAEIKEEARVQDQVLEVDNTKITQEQLTNRILSSYERVKKANAEKNKALMADAEALHQQNKEKELMAATGTINTFGNVFGTLGSFYEQGSKQYKQFASIQVAMSTTASAIEAYKSTAAIPIVGPALAPLAAATAVAFGLRQLQQINKTDTSISKGEGGGGRRKFSKGGLLRGRSHAGGGIPGIITSTGEPIEMEGGEYIIRKEVVNNLGVYALESLNRKFATGGLVNPLSDTSTSGIDISNAERSTEVLIGEFRNFKNEITAWQRSLTVVNSLQEVDRGVKVLHRLQEDSSV